MNDNRWLQIQDTSKEKVKIKLGGMTCASCAFKIETKLKNLDGVNSSVVNFANEEATVEYNPKTTNYNEFNRAIRDLGYKATLAKMDIKITDTISENEFNSLVTQVKDLTGVYDVRGNYQANKLLMKLNVC